MFSMSRSKHSIISSQKIRKGRLKVVLFVVFDLIEFKIVLTFKTIVQSGRRRPLLSF